MGRYANLKKMEFWQESNPIRRLEMLREARNGGSITPTYAKILKSHETRGALRVCTMANIEDATWRADEKKWALDIQTSSAPAKDALFGTTRATRLETISADFIVAATGTTPSFLTLPFIQSLSQNPDISPCPTVGGLPLLTSNLQWPGLPLFCVGGYSALQVGPGAFNLGGMREAADRVVERLGDLTLGDVDGIIQTQTTGAKVSDQTYTYFDFNLLAVEG